MKGPMNWVDYGRISHDRGCLALEVFVCHTVPARPGPPSSALLAAHLEYQKGLEAAGKLFLAGPLSDEAAQAVSGAGLIVYFAATLAEARILAEADPMHSDGQRRFILQAWRLNEGAPLPGLRLSSRSFDLQSSCTAPSSAADRPFLAQGARSAGAPDTS